MNDQPPTDPVGSPATDRIDPIPAGADFWMLRLYVAGPTPKCLAALARLKALCEVHLAGRYSIEVIDLLENPRLARDEEIVAIPTLVRRLPPPIRKIIGDLSNQERTLVELKARSPVS
jgi:circadian clock protein KaiB